MGKIFLQISIITLFLFTKNCYSIAARLGIWIDSTSGYTVAPKTSYWKSAYISKRHKSSYVGGHGFGGTSFDDVDVYLILQAKNNQSKDILLEHASIPGDSKDGLIYDLISRNYELKFSDDGKKLAITYDHEFYGFVGLDLTDDYLIFSRYKKYKPSDNDFWKAFPEPKELAVELLQNRLLGKYENYAIQSSKEPYFKNSVYSVYQDDLEKPLESYVKSHLKDKEVLLAALKGILEMGDRYLPPKELPEIVAKESVHIPEIKKTILEYLGTNKMSYTAKAYAFSIIRKSIEKEELSSIAKVLDSAFFDFNSTAKSDPSFLGSQLRRMFWATAAICKKLKVVNPQLESVFKKMIESKDVGIYEPAHSMKIYTIQSMSYSNSPDHKTYLKELSKKYPTKNEIKNDFWPKEYTDPYRNDCEWEDKYSNCSPLDLSVWLKLAIENK